MNYTYEVRPGVRAKDGSFERWPLLFVNDENGRMLRGWAIGDETPEAVEKGKKRDEAQMRALERLEHDDKTGD